jgi:hypothetical protein
MPSTALSHYVSDTWSLALPDGFGSAFPRKGIGENLAYYLEKEIISSSHVFFRFVPSSPRNP